MKTDIALFLFGLPEFELQEYTVNGAGLREYAAKLAQSLGDIADLVDKLEKDGWIMEIRDSNLVARHPQVTIYERAVARLARLGIKESDVTDIAEWDDCGRRLTCGG